MNMKSAAFAAALAFCAPSVALAATITTQNDTVMAHALAGNGANATTLQAGWSFSPAVTTVAAPASSDPSSRSPWELDNETISTALTPASPGFFTIGINGTNVSSQAVLDLGGRHTSFSLLWGSPDTYNTLELLLDGALAFAVIPGSTLGGPSAPQLGASFVSISDTLFNAVRFTSTSNAFEWASMNATAVPIPAPFALLLASLAALGFVSRRRKAMA